MKTILITGAGGGIGGHLRREFAGKYRMRLSDIRPIENISSNESLHLSPWTVRRKLFFEIAALARS